MHRGWLDISRNRGKKLFAKIDIKNKYKKILKKHKKQLTKFDNHANIFKDEATDKNIKKYYRRISKKLQQKKEQKQPNTSFLFCLKKGKKKYLKNIFKMYWQAKKLMLK